MLRRFALAAAAASFLFAVVPAEAAMPSPVAGAPHDNYSSSQATPVKAHKKVIYVKKKVCHPVYKWRTVWWKGHWTKVKVKVAKRGTIRVKVAGRADCGDASLTVVKAKAKAAK